jgi:CubicO group peptidase (beta-lactamase class C family)
MLYLRSVALVLLALTAACEDSSRSNDAAVDAIFGYWDQAGSPGCAIGIAQSGEVIYARGYGYANLDYDIPVTPQSVFDIASLNKQLVAASLKLLELEGKLTLDDKVRKWLPELPEFETPITLRHMIYHTSGLRDYLNLFPLAGRNHYFPISHPQILAMMSRQRAPIFAPGDQYLYSNTAYMLLAQVVERASGSSFGEFADSRFFGPLGMQGSLMYDNYEEIIPRRATGYDRYDDGRVLQVHNYNFDVPGDGQQYSTVLDMLRWDDYLHGEVKPPFYAAMMTRGSLNNGERLDRGMGLFLGDYRGLSRVYHTGSSWGSRALLMRFPDADWSVAIACNDGNANTLQLGEQVADLFLADRFTRESVLDAQPGDQDVPVQKPRPAALNEAQLAEYVGMFFSPELDAIYRFAFEDGSLVVRIEQEPAAQVIATATDRFEMQFDDAAYWDPPDASMVFQRDADGAIKGFSLSSWTERGIQFEKLP